MPPAIRNYYLLVGFFLLSFSTFAQETSLYGPVDERLLIETKWRYTYTLHVESNTIIHQADNRYDYYLYFRYDYSYQQHLNGVASMGWWKLKERQLNYTFKQVTNFEIADVNKKRLVLEFTRRNSKGTFQYHFVRVESKDAPFIKPVNELPDVIVEAVNAKKEKRDWFAFTKRKKKRKKSKYEPVEKPTYINIEITGGGYYGGIDPVLKDMIHIKSTGRLIKEFHSVNHGLLVTKKDIPREELEEFAEYIIQQKFFEFDRLYDCEDLACQHRKQLKPRPIPLRISVTYGDRKKVITLAIWGKDNRNMKYVNYPPALDNIIDAIQRMANRLEDPVVRR